MSKITAFVNVTLDGVVQAPGRPDEDRRGDFQHGGWAAPYADEVLGRVAAESMATNWGHPARPPDLPGLLRLLRLVDTTTTTTGVIVATYQPAEAAPEGPR